MATQIDVVSALKSIPDKKKSLQKSFSDLESQRNSLLKRPYEWKELDDHFTDVEKSLRKKYEELVEKEKVFEAKKKDVQAGIDKRDAAITTAEQASLARVQEQKDAAVAVILEQKRKWSEERQRLEGGLARPDPKPAGQAASSLETKQTPKKPTTSSVAQAKDVDTKMEDAANGPSVKDAGQKDKEPGGTLKTEVKARPQLKSLCENLDGLGLKKFIADRRKDSPAIRAELPAALKCSIDPARLVLKALEGYYSPDQKPTAADKKDSAVAASRRACVLLLEALAEVLADPVLGIDHPVVSSNIKEAAKVVADDWKSKMNVNSDHASGFSLDAQSFLQLAATFGLGSEYDVGELCKLVTTIARRKQTPSLCRSLGLTTKIPEVVDMLINEGKQIEALSFANTFSLLDRFQPVPLLKSYLKEARKAAQATLKSGDNSAAAQNDATNKELSALRAVLKCIDEYKLEAQYPSANLQTRVAQLEKAKTDRKRAADTARALTKKPRTNNAAGVFSTPAQSERPLYRPSERAPFGGVGVSSFGLGAHPSYDRPPQGGYGPALSVGNRSPVSLSRSYLYSADGMGSSLYGSSVFTNPASSYGGYQYGAGLPPPSAYQGPYLR